MPSVSASVGPAAEDIGGEEVDQNPGAPLSNVKNRHGGKQGRQGGGPTLSLTSKTNRSQGSSMGDGSMSEEDKQELSRLMLEPLFDVMMEYSMYAHSDMIDEAIRRMKQAPTAAEAIKELPLQVYTFLVRKVQYLLRHGPTAKLPLGDAERTDFANQYRKTMQDIQGGARKGQLVTVKNVPALPIEP
ncbi:hypothetical protein WJX75_002882 [Coccomyxa subellipsoidea]|uniref:Uncharacterized protein n=1 Tax=Coccomyxa subellipsoidea TaxID=248742 RepID=A0ABR2YVF9_9CHLO